MSRTTTVRGPLVTELLGDPGPPPARRGWEIDCGAHPTHCPMCRRAIVAAHLAEHLDCYDPDANCSVADVAAWFRLSPPR